MSFKESLLGALKSAVDGFNSGLTPNAAVVKAATDNDYNPEQTRRLVESFNTARTLCHFKTAEDRTVEFELADADQVLGEIYKEPTAKAAEAPEADYSFYRTPRYATPVEHLSKAAAADEFEPAMSSLNLENLCHLAERAYRTQCQEAKFAFDTGRLMGETANANFTKLAEYLNSGHSDDTQERFARLTVAFTDSPKHAAAMRKLAEFVRPSVIPTADQIAKVGKVVDIRDLAQYERMIDKAAEQMEQEIIQLSVASQMAKEADDFIRDFYVTLSPMLKQAKVPAGPFDGTIGTQFQVSSKPQSDGKKGGGKGEGGAPFKALDDLFGVGKNLASSITEGGLGAMGAEAGRENAAMSDRLKNVQRQLLLQDLVSTDPVLSEADPNAVAQAYTSIVSMAPDMSMQKEIVRAVLRQAVHSLAIGPYDAQTWTELEKNMRAISGKGVKPAVEPKKSK